jgi:hypothetical protein
VRAASVGAVLTRALAACLALALLTSTGSRADAKGAPSLCSVPYPSAAAIEWTCLRLRAGDTLQRLFGDRWIDVARFNRVDRRHVVAGVELKVPARLDDIRDFTPLPSTYPAADADAKLILIDLSEQYLGAYEYGRRAFSAPVATGEAAHATPTGDFRITAADPRRRSSLYTIENTDVAYPMNWALRFHLSRQGIAYWIHGRDLPGYPASHGCIGLYDERMQAEYYGDPRDPILRDAQTLYEWVLGSRAAADGFQTLGDGPRVRIVGAAPPAQVARADAGRGGCTTSGAASSP